MHVVQARQPLLRLNLGSVCMSHFDWLSQTAVVASCTNGKCGDLPERSSHSSNAQATSLSFTSRRHFVTEMKLVRPGPRSEHSAFSLNRRCSRTLDVLLDARHTDSMRHGDKAATPDERGCRPARQRSWKNSDSSSGR